MKDAIGRAPINYMRFSITDRCNLRCTYCMPNGVALEPPRGPALRYEEFLRKWPQAAVELGITRFKVTGGEPLVRRGCVEFLSAAESAAWGGAGDLDHQRACGWPLWPPSWPQMGLDGVNISLDAADPVRFCRHHGRWTATARCRRGLQAAADGRFENKAERVCFCRDVSPGCPLVAELAAAIAACGRAVYRGHAHRGGSLERWPHPRGSIEHPAGPLAGPASCAGGAGKRPCPLLRQFGIARPHWND